MKKIHTEIDIGAPASIVWRHLTEFSNYPHWNTFITFAEGNLGSGEQLKITVVPAGGRPMTFRPFVTRFQPNVELCWLGKLAGLPFLFTGEHCFWLKRLNRSATRFVQEECFRGILVPLVWKSMSVGTRSGFEEMNLALKRRAEDGSQNPGG
jgi:hypothetical protein